jgi:hypothetical protein
MRSADSALDFKSVIKRARESKCQVQKERIERGEWITSHANALPR